MSYQIPAKPFASEAKASSLYARHQKLKERVLCAAEWAGGRLRDNHDENHRIHTCGVFRGHCRAPHKCVCGATLKVKR